MVGSNPSGWLGKYGAALTLDRCGFYRRGRLRKLEHAQESLVGLLECGNFC
jgi:hypothetical protein